MAIRVVSVPGRGFWLFESFPLPEGDFGYPVCSLYRKVLGRGCSLRVARPAVPLPKPLPPRARLAGAVPALGYRLAYCGRGTFRSVPNGTRGRFVLSQMGQGDVSFCPRWDSGDVSFCLQKRGVSRAWAQRQRGVPLGGGVWGGGPRASQL